MKFLDEYRDGALTRRYFEAIRRVTTRPWRIMEVCGGQTHSIVRFGIDQLLPSEITLLHGPGCPVCVTPLELVDQAIDIAAQPGVVFCSFGDMLRVPGSDADLLQAKSAGADVRIVYSPLDALELARQNPGKQVVFFAVGFETTAPANAMAVFQAAREQIENFSMLVSHVLVPPALEAILQTEDCQVDGFLAAGHVCTIMGLEEYAPICQRHQVPIVATGFEPADLLQGILMCIELLERGEARLENQYARAVKPAGNPSARQMIQEVFQITPRRWRGIGDIPQSGLGLRDAYARFDATRRFQTAPRPSSEPSECISGLVLQGLRKPSECPAFGKRCRPESPLGATMVSNEGACAAYYRYRGSAANS